MQATGVPVKIKYNIVQLGTSCRSSITHSGLGYANQASVRMPERLFDLTGLAMIQVGNGDAFA